MSRNPAQDEPQPSINMFNMLVKAGIPCSFDYMKKQRLPCRSCHILQEQNDTARSTNSVLGDQVKSVNCD